MFEACGDRRTTSRPPDNTALPTGLNCRSARTCCSPPNDQLSGSWVRASNVSKWPDRADWSRSHSSRPPSHSSGRSTVRGWKGTRRHRGRFEALRHRRRCRRIQNGGHESALSPPRPTSLSGARSAGRGSPPRPLRTKERSRPVAVSRTSIRSRLRVGTSGHPNGHFATTSLGIYFRVIISSDHSKCVFVHARSSTNAASHPRRYRDCRRRCGRKRRQLLTSRWRRCRRSYSLCCRPRTARSVSSAWRLPGR
jgi:hypothetical protein